MTSITLPGGGELAYSETGSGPPLVLVHGSPGEGRSWARVAPLLAGSFRVVMLDLPGYGRSTPIPDHPEGRTAAIGAALAALIASFGQPAHVCGHSYGGNVALHAALAKSEIANLTLLEPVFFRALDLTSEDVKLKRSVQFFEDYAARVIGGEAEAVSEMIDFWFGGGAFSKLPAPVQSYLKTSAPKNGRDVNAALSETPTIEQLAALPIPTTIAYGDASPQTAPDIAKALAKLLPNARLEVISGAHHGMLDTHPHAVAALIGQSN